MMLKGEKVANEYVGVFSRMLRSTLEMSLLENSILIEEINYIKSYILLQNLRRQHPINLEIDVSQSIDLHQLSIAPMLMQPIIENAFLHGLSTIKENGLIKIRIWEKKESLYIQIKDNGVGRKKAQKLKIKSQHSDNIHKSLATKILKERLDVFNYLYKARSDFMLTDHVISGEIKGTKALLILPKIINKSK